MQRIDRYIADHESFIRIPVHAQNQINFIENIVSGNDLYKEARESVNDKINYYKDGNCCKRVAETFIK